MKDRDGSFSCRFFLHGWRYVSPGAAVRLERLKSGEELYVTLELTNPAHRARRPDPDQGLPHDRVGSSLSRP